QYLGDKMKDNLTETVRNYKTYLPKYLPLPHPSPRNRFWLGKNPWFMEEVVPLLQAKVKVALG
ncbi:MAG: uracil-DNA glycosylase family protein, partial [Bacteroidota bacterium]